MSAALLVALALAAQPGHGIPVEPAPGQPVPPQPPGAGSAPGRAQVVLTLDDALREAESRNLDLVAARARLAQARELSARVWTSYLPQISAGASVIRNSVEAAIQTGPGAEVVIQPLYQRAAQLEGSQLVIAPALFPAIRNAYRAEEIAAVSTENARREILFGVAQLYYGTVGLKQGLEVQQRLLETRLAHEKDARVRYQAGTTPKVALLRAEIDRSTAEQDVKRAENAYASARVSLATLLDREPDFEVEVPAAPATQPDGSALEDAALRDRQDVRAARQTEDLARRTRDAVFYRYLPSVSATGFYRVSNAAGFAVESTSWAVTLGLNWILYDGGLREVDLRENKARLLEASANRENAENRAREEVRRGRLDLESAIANRQKAVEQLSLARENHRLVEASYRAGAATYLEVGDAQTALQNAELGAVGEQLDADLAALRLLRAAGAFNPK